MKKDKKITFYILYSTWTCFPLRMAAHQSWSQKPIFRGSDHEMNISATRNSGLSKFVNRCLKVWQIVHERFYRSSNYDHKTEFGTGTLEDHIFRLIFITIGIDIDLCSSKWKSAFFCSTKTVSFWPRVDIFSCPGQLNRWPRQSVRPWVSELTFDYNDYNAQCVLCSVRWPCSHYNIKKKGWQGHV